MKTTQIMSGILCVLGVLCGFFACAGKDEHQHEQGEACAHVEKEACGHGDEHANEGCGAERGVEVSDAAAELIGLTLTRVEKRRLGSTVGFYGRVAPDPRARRSVSLPLPGFVSWRIGAPCEIKPGDELLRLVSPDAAAVRGELTVLETRVAAVRQAGARNAALAAELAAKRSAYAAMTNALEAVDAVSGEFVLRAAARGRVDELLVANGAFADRGSDVLKMTEAKQPAVFALVPVAEARGLADGSAARVGVRSGSVRVDRTRDDGLVGVWVTFEAEGASLPNVGESVYVTHEFDPAGEAVACVPSAAIFREGITPCVFVRDEHDADRFVVKPVVPGVSAAGWTAVTGLAADEEVVSQGVYELKQALPSAGGEKKSAGHFHADGKECE